MLILIVLSALFIWSSNGLLCDLHNSKISCTGIINEDLYNNITAVLDPEDVLDLNITNASISSIDKIMFAKYKYMHSLCLENVRLKNVFEGAFADLSNLRNLFLTHNLLENFNSNIFNAGNVLQSLDLSRNLIQDLNDFNITLFPTLKLMNISNNKLETLPEQLISKLKNEEEFYLIVDDNPWNCEQIDWMQDMDLTLKAAFCEEFNDFIQNDASTSSFSMDEPIQYDVKGARNANIESKILCAYESRCFSYCIFWFVGGIWLGVILGNACKIKSLIFKPKVTFVQERDTQCEMVHQRLKE